jgi:hypothetical protein
MFMEGKAGLDALLNIIHNEGHSAKKLVESDLKMMIRGGGI